MNYRIEYITCKNFKFFYGTDDNNNNRLELDGKNLLMYGENGCGKSSLYWALYTFFQSSIKQDVNQVKKYFDPINEENLRNRFCAENEDSGIYIGFVDDNNNLVEKEISSKAIETINDDIVYKTLVSSDFINYKFLSKLYDFRNSQVLDLFPVFEKDLLSFIDFTQDFKNENNLVEVGKTIASDWWDNIVSIPERLPKTKLGYVNITSNQYKIYTVDIIPNFCQLLNKYVQSLLTKTNKYLKDFFKCNLSVKIDFDISTCYYDVNEKKLHNPIIKLKVEYNHIKLTGGHCEISKPHTFLNEAKLTSIALSIRLAMIDLRLRGAANSAKILVLDDLLLSLDMSNRDIVLDIILKKMESYQIFFLTHDRALYNLAKMRIESYGIDGNWIFKEMYNSQINSDDIPRPIYVDSKSNLELALKYLSSYDYPASGNYMRKECEHILRSLLPKKLTFTQNDDGTVKLASLRTLINNFNDNCKNMNITIPHNEKLMEYKNLLLNPLSHDNLESPIYREELVSCYNFLKDLDKFKKKIICDDKLTDFIYLKLQDKNGIEWEYKVQPLECFYLLTDPNNVTHYNNPLCKFIKISNQEGYNKKLHNCNKKLNKGIKQICAKLGIALRTDVAEFCYDNNHNKIGTL